MSQRRVPEHGVSGHEGPEHVAPESEFDPTTMVWVDDSDDPFGEDAVNEDSIDEDMFVADVSFGDIPVDNTFFRDISDVRVENTRVTDAPVTGIYVEHGPVEDVPVEDVSFNDASLADALLDGVPDAVADDPERENVKVDAQAADAQATSTHERAVAVRDTRATDVQVTNTQVTDTAIPAHRVRADALCLCDIDAFEDVLEGKADTCTLKVVHDQSQGVATSGVAGPRMVRSDPTLTTLECDAEMLREFLADDYPMTSAEDGTVGLSASIPVTFRGDVCEVADVATWAPGRDVGEKTIDTHRMFCDLAQQCELIAADERVAPDAYVATVRDVFTPELLERMASYHGVNIDAGLQESVRRFGDMVSREDDKVEQLPRREALRPGTVAYKVAAYRDAMTDGQDYAFKPGGMSF